MLLKPKRGHDCGFRAAHRSAYPSSMSKNQLCRFVPSGPEVHFVMRHATVWRTGRREIVSLLNCWDWIAPDSFLCEKARRVNHFPPGSVSFGMKVRSSVLHRIAGKLVVLADKTKKHCAGLKVREGMTFASWRCARDILERTLSRILSHVSFLRNIHEIDRKWHWCAHTRTHTHTITHARTHTRARTLLWRLCSNFCPCWCECCPWHSPWPSWLIGR